jgi:hypothetical protein
VMPQEVKAARPASRKVEPPKAPAKVKAKPTRKLGNAKVKKAPAKPKAKSPIGRAKAKPRPMSKTAQRAKKKLRR